MATQLPSWNQAAFLQPRWNNMYFPSTPQQHITTESCAINEIDSRVADYEGQVGVSCPADWYLDSTGSLQVLQFLPSLKQFSCISYTSLKN